MSPEPTQTHSRDLVRALAALADENRYRIVQMLAHSAEQDLSCAAIGSHLQLSASLVSHHLAVLETSGLIQRRKNGFWTLNRLCRAELSRHVGALQALLDGALPSSNGGGAPARLNGGADNGAGEAEA